MNKITIEFILFCCKYAEGYIFDGIDETKEFIFLLISNYNKTIEVNKLSVLDCIIIRDLIKRVRQGINDKNENWFVHIKDNEYGNMNSRLNCVYVLPLNNDMKRFFYIDYKQSDNFTIEELALIDAIDYIRLQENGK